MSLQKTLEEIKLIKPQAEEDLESYDLNDPRNANLISTMGVRRGRKLQAVEQLKRLRMQYSDGLLRGAAFIITVGSDAEQFEEVASTFGNCLKANAEGLYEDLSNRVHPTLYVGRVSDSNLFDVVGRHLEDKAGELGINEYPQLLFKHELARQIDSPEDLKVLLKEALTDQVGGEMVGINAVRELTDSAIEREYTSSVAPILLSTKDQQFALDLIPHLERLTRRVYLIVVGKAPKKVKSIPGAIVLSEVSEESVTGALTKIRDSLNK